MHCKIYFYNNKYQVKLNSCLMKNRQSLLLWMLLFFGSVSVFAQHVVKGRITDAKTGEPLVGVNVVLKGSSESGTISDLNGNYSLSVPESSSLIFSYIGYVTQEISVKVSQFLIFLCLKIWKLWKKLW